MIRPDHGDHAARRSPDDEPEDFGRLAFRITRVHRDRRVVASAPWHEPGGDWTFFDAVTESPEKARFTVGVRTKPADGPIDWGEAMIFSPDAASATSFLAALGRAFDVEPPAPRPAPPAIAPREFGTAVLGEGFGRDPAGGFQGDGTWTATKWFLQRDGALAEVYFNYSLSERRGEFSEKDEDYRDDLVKLLAIELRDGPKPSRTPATDPNLTDAGPKFVDPRVVATNVRLFEFAPGGRRLVYVQKSHTGDRVQSIDPARPESPRPAPLFEGRVCGVAPLDPNAARLVVVAALPESPDVYSSADPKRLWLVDAAAGKRERLAGEWERPSLEIDPAGASPDGRFVALRSDRVRSDGVTPLPVNHLLDASTGEIRTLAKTGLDWRAVAWWASPAGLRLVLRERREWGDRRPVRHLLVDPTTLATSVPDGPPWDAAAPIRVAPSGELVASFDGDEERAAVLITRVSSGEARRFPLHEDDRGYAFEDALAWLDDRRIALDFPRPAILDVDSFKMSFPLPPEEECRPRVGSDLQFAAWLGDDDSLVVARVATPDERP